MTSTQAQTGNEQRIASLEAELVTLRGALEVIQRRSDYAENPGDGPHETILHDLCSCANSALVSTADYANKVVVDQDDQRLALRWGVMLHGHIVMACISKKRAEQMAVLGSRDSGAPVRVVDCDALRKGGGE